MRVAGARAAALAALVTAGACGRSPPAARFVGESEHFRLYIEAGLFVPPELEGENGLAALETAWSDAYSMLKMPDGKINYYWLASEHIPEACATTDEQACFWDETLEIDSPTFPNPHELNHAYMYLRNPRRPIPFLAEGIAEAIGCEFWGETTAAADTPWQPLVASPRNYEAYVQGGALVRHLIRRFGIEEFLRYYEQSPERRDPALFASNFAGFWGVTVDEVWRDIHDHPTNLAFNGDHKICPCSLPPVPTGGTVVNDRARAPYWTLPPLAGETIALTARMGDRVRVQDCGGVQQPSWAQGVLARLDDATPARYVLAPLASATVDHYLSDDCPAAATYTIDPVFKTGIFHDLELVMSRPVSSKATAYLQITTPFTWPLRTGLDGICDSCGFDPVTCPPYRGNVGPQIAQGTFYGQTTFYTAIANPTADTVWNLISISP